MSGIRYTYDTDRVVSRFARAHLITGVRPGEFTPSQYRHGQGSLDLKWRAMDQLTPAAQSIMQRMQQYAVARAQGLPVDEPISKGYNVPAEPGPGPVPDVVEPPAPHWLRNAGRKVYRAVVQHATTSKAPLRDDPIGREAKRALRSMHAAHAEGNWHALLGAARQYHGAVRGLDAPLAKGGWKRVPADEGGGELTTKRDGAVHVFKQKAYEEAYRAKHSTAAGPAQKAIEHEARPSRIYGMVRQAQNRWDTAHPAVHNTPEGKSALGHLTAARQHLDAGEVDHAHRNLTRFHFHLDGVQQKYGSAKKLVVNPLDPYMLKALGAGEKNGPTTSAFSSATDFLKGY